MFYEKFFWVIVQASPSSKIAALQEKGFPKYQGASSGLGRPVTAEDLSPQNLFRSIAGTNPDRTLFRSNECAKPFRQPD